MKHSRLLSILCTLVLLFPLAAQCVMPVAAIRASEAGIYVTKYSTFYNSEKNRYGFTFHFNRTGGENTHVTAYLYNAQETCVLRWTEGEDGYALPFGESSRSFGIDSAKFTGTFTVKLVVYTEVTDIYKARYGLEFQWHYTVDSNALVPSIQFKQMTHSLDESGSAVPCINVATKNLNGGTVTMAVYDSYGSCIYKESSAKLKSNSADVRFSWYGESNGQYFPSGEYKVVITSSKGQSITDKFHFNFPEMKSG